MLKIISLQPSLGDEAGWIGEEIRVVVDHADGD